MKLNPLQKDLVRSLVDEETFIAVRAGWGSGKTSALVFGLLMISKLRPGSASLLIGVHAASLRAAALMGHPLL